MCAICCQLIWNIPRGIEVVSVCTVPARGGRSCERFGGYKTINRIPLPLHCIWFCLKDIHTSVWWVPVRYPHLLLCIIKVTREVKTSLKITPINVIIAGWVSMILYLFFVYSCLLNRRCLTLQEHTISISGALFSYIFVNISPSYVQFLIVYAYYIFCNRVYMWF